MGIDAIEIAAINNENDFFNRYPYEDLKTHNDTVYDKVHTTFAKRIGYVIEQCTRVSDSIQRCMNAGHFPIVLSGDHSSALGTMSGIKAVHPGKNLGVIWIDAHSDIHSPFTSPSGNVHGMPLAAALGEDNRDNQVNSVTPATQTSWENMKNLSVSGPKVKPEHLIYLGVRDTELQEKIQISQLGIKIYTVEEIRHRGLRLCISEALTTLEHCEMLYISFDVDSLDCDMISHGTGTPVPKGFDQYEIIGILKHFIRSGKVCCLEIAEINPLLDTRGNRMAETAFEVLDATVRLIESFSLPDAEPI